MEGRECWCIVADGAMGRPWGSGAEGDITETGCLSPGMGRCLSGSIETERVRVSKRNTDKCRRMEHTNPKGSKRFKNFPRN